MARPELDSQPQPLLDYHAVSFSQGPMDFQWASYGPEERRRAYTAWAAGKGLIGGDPRQRPSAHLLPTWGLNRPFFRTLALADSRGRNGARLTAALASSQPLEIEIGFGRGDTLMDRARQRPQSCFLGYEVKTKAARLLLQRLERFQIENVWVSDDDCRFSLPRTVPDSRAAVVHIFFPDPWWKKQHQAKRLFTPPFVDLLAAKLQPGGLLHFKSDVEAYGDLVRHLVESHPAFEAHKPALAAEIGPCLPTHREQWCQHHGLPTWCFLFQRRTDG